MIDLSLDNTLDPGQSTYAPRRHGWRRKYQDKEIGEQKNEGGRQQKKKYVLLFLSARQRLGKEACFAP